MFRKKMSKHGSKKLFRRTASRVHRKNSPRTSPMRGGIRL
jgi:hypothetical protein